MERREFLKLAGAATVSGVPTNVTGQKVRILVDPKDILVASPPVAWSLRQLGRAVMGRGAAYDVIDTLPTGAFRGITVLLGTSAELTHPESLRIEPHAMGGARTLRVTGADARGLMYAVMELRDRVEQSTDGTLGLDFKETIEEAPANVVRSAQRAFCSEKEDKPWFYDKAFWTGYLDMLAANRFNRFNLALGFGYDFPKGVTDDYFHFPYPYLVDVPGYEVRVVPLAAGERERNLAAFRFIAAETAARGLEFQLGLWTHAYAWTDSPKAYHHIEGLTPGNHAAYCRDALAMLLKEAPAITGVTMRVHGESGIPEGSYPFWETLFEAITKCGRTIEIDMHAKGINQIMIDMAAKTGMPVKVSAKYSAEHMGLGYHQADIRELEIPRADRMESGVFSVSNGDRRFTRYGYADLFQEGRRFDVLFRLWPGTQKHLVWGDPETAAGYARTAHFCGAKGLELCEPLTFKGREGSAGEGGRCAYATASLSPRYDWEKFAYTYRLWGRLLYNPDCDAEVWRRSLKKTFGASSPAAETAMANASRILPLITTAHMASASNHSYWPEIYENMPMLEGGDKSPYSDTPVPRVFATVSPLDPQLFSSMREYVDEVLSGKVSARYSPIAVASWLEHLSYAAEMARSQVGSPASVQALDHKARWQADVEIQTLLARFFAAKIRSGVAWEIYLRTGSAEAGKIALDGYMVARGAWFSIGAGPGRVYVQDITYGSTPGRRGDWADRLPAIDRDLAAMRAALAKPGSASGEVSAERVRVALGELKSPRLPAAAQGSHTPPVSFHAGAPLEVQFVSRQSTTQPAVSLMYRHVNHAERWRSMAMQKQGEAFHATIGAEYTESPFPLQYYFVVETAGQAAALFPGFNSTLSNQPYYAVWRRV